MTNNELSKEEWIKHIRSIANSMLFIGMLLGMLDWI